MLTRRGWVSEACDTLFVFIVIALLSWLGTSTPRADELFDDEEIRGVLGSDACPADSKIEGPPQAVGLASGSERDLFRLKRIAGGDLRGEFCLVESQRQLVGASQSASALFRRDNGPWRKVKEGYAMEVLETRTNGYPDISLPYWPPGKPRADRIWRAHVWDGQEYKPKHGPPSSLSGHSGYDGFNGVVSDGADRLFIVGAEETSKKDESRGFLRLLNGALDIDFSAAPANVTSSAYVDVIRLSDGDVVIVGWQRAVGALTDNCSVMRSSPEGKVRWRQVLGGSSHDRCYFVLELPNGELLVGGRTEPSTSGKDTASGAVWHLNAGTGSPTSSAASTIRSAGVQRSAFQGATVLADGSVILVGWATNPDRGDDDIWLVKQDPAGRLVWERRIGEEGANLATTVIATADGGALVVGYHTKKGAASTSGLVMTISADGNPGWMRELDVGPAGNDKLYHGVLLPDGSLIAVGTASKDAKAPFVGWMVHLDRAGKLLREWLIEEPPGGRLNGVARVHGSGLIAVGSARDVGRSDVDGWVVEVDEPQIQSPSNASGGTLKPLAAVGGGERSPTADTAALQAALDGLVGDLSKKIDHDIDTIADAFWAVREIERARRLADIFGVPFTALNLTISTLSQITNAKDIVAQFPKVAASNWLSAAAYVAGMGAIEDAGGNLRWALSGPAYVGKIKQMYEQAAKTGSEQEFKNVIRQSLHASTWIKAPPASIERGIPAMSYGTRLLLASVGQSVAALKEKLAAPGEVPDPEALKQAVAVLREMHTKLIASQAGAVQVPLRGADRQQTSAELAMGSIAQFLKVHADVLGRYDAELKQRQIEVAVDAGKSIGRTVLLGLSFGSGDALTTVQSSVLAVDSLAWSGAKHAFKADVRSLVADIPQQMVFSLSNEFSNAWQLAEGALGEGQKLVMKRNPLIDHASEQESENRAPAADDKSKSTRTEGIGIDWKSIEAMRSFVKTVSAETRLVCEGQGVFVFVGSGDVLLDDAAVLGLVNDAIKDYTNNCRSVFSHSAKACVCIKGTECVIYKDSDSRTICHVVGIFQSRDSKILGIDNRYKRWHEQQEASKNRVEKLAPLFRRLNVDAIVEIGQLATNPFLWVNKVVVVAAVGLQMVGESEAIFRRSPKFMGQNPFVVTDMPAERFVADEEIYVVGRVIGTKVPGGVSGAQLPLAHLQYLGDFSGYPLEEVKSALAQAQQ